MCRLLYHSSHAYYTLPLWASIHVQHSCAWCIYLYLQIHSLTHVLTYSWPAQLALLGLGALALALSSLQLACTPPLQLGTRLLRVALVSYSRPPCTACVGYV